MNLKNLLKLILTHRQVKRVVKSRFSSTNQVSWSLVPSKHDDNFICLVNFTLKNLNSEKVETPSFVEAQRVFLNKQEIQLRIPEELKIILTDDWELITTQNKLLCLPATYNINKILDHYLSAKINAPKLPANHTIDGYVSFLFGLRNYFNLLINKCLLYESEQKQFKYLMNNYEELFEQMKNSPIVGPKSKKFKKNGNKGASTHFVSDLPSTFHTDSSSSNTQSSDSLLLPELCTNDRKDNLVSGSMGKRKVVPTELYGGIHLLRMFTKLGQFLFHTDISEDQISLLNTYAFDFLKYLCKNLWIFGSESSTSYNDACLLEMKVERINN